MNKLHSRAMKLYLKSIGRWAKYTALTTCIARRGSLSFKFDGYGVAVRSIRRPHAEYKSRPCTTVNPAYTFRLSSNIRFAHSDICGLVFANKIYSLYNVKRMCMVSHRLISRIGYAR